jgi:acyl carrier protein
MTLDTHALLNFLEEHLGVDAAQLNEDTPLFSSGIVDSAGMVTLIVFVESCTGMKFTPDDITLDHLDSIGRILDFVTAGRPE